MTPQKKCSVIAEHDGGPNGLALHPDGDRLIITED